MRIFNIFSQTTHPSSNTLPARSACVCETGRFGGRLTPPGGKAKTKNANFRATAGALVLAGGGVGGGPTASLGDHTITEGRATRADIEIQLLFFPRTSPRHEKTPKTMENA